MVNIKKCKICRLLILGQLLSPILNHIPISAIIRKSNCLIDTVFYIVNHLIHRSRNNVLGNINIVVCTCARRKCMLHNSDFFLICFYLFFEYCGSHKNTSELPLLNMLFVSYSITHIFIILTCIIEKIQELQKTV